jgi:hypothetical protein
MALAHLGVGREEEALGYILKAAANPYVGESFTSYNALVLNAYNDPVLDKPEFREAREQLNFASGGD